MPPRAQAGVVQGSGRAVRGGLAVALGAVMLMWTALVNGRPAVFTDTALYYSQAEYLFEALHLVQPADAAGPPGDPTALPARPGAPNLSAAIDAARSPAYGAFLYALQRSGGLWLVAGAQALAVAGVVRVLYAMAAPRARRGGYLLLMAVLAALTPLPFFTSWAMPDVFAGVAACGLLTLLVYADRLRPVQLAGLCAGTAFGLAAHRSNLLDALALALAAAPLLRRAGVPWGEVGRRLGLAGLSAALALAGASVLIAPIRARAGEPIGSPPFLSARLIADGAGRTYLRQACRDRPAAFALCAFRDRPLATSDQILWSNRRRSAVFVAAPAPLRARMEAEDARFALDALAAHPLQETGAALANAALQFAEVGVDDPLKDPRFYVANGYWRRTALPRILPGARACAASAGCRPRIAPAVSWALEGVGLGASALLLAWRLAGAGDAAALLHRGRPAPASGSPGDDLARILVLLALVGVLLAANAAVCGALSGPFPRYQARLAWLAPLGAGLLLAGAGWRRRPAAASLDAPPGGL